jgi:hypothetical protein
MPFFLRFAFAPFLASLELEIRKQIPALVHQNHSAIVDPKCRNQVPSFFELAFIWCFAL